jgi:hypothetical protein
MNIHTLSTIGLIVGGVVTALSLSGVLVSLETSVSWRWPAGLFVLAVLSAGVFIASAYSADLPWSSPRVTAAIAAGTVRISNTLGSPTTPRQVLATASSAATLAAGAVSNNYTAVVTKSNVANSLVLALAGDSVRACLTYHPARTKWSWSPGPCR